MWNREVDNAPVENAADISRYPSIPESVGEADLALAEVAPVRVIPADLSAGISATLATSEEANVAG